MAPIAFDYHQRLPAVIKQFLWKEIPQEQLCAFAEDLEHPPQRHAAVLVEFLAMLAVETVLNHPHCSEFFHRPWL